MYANCLQEGVKQQGLPVMACEDQKSYATCKYVVGEIFQVIPITTFFDYYMKLIRGALSNPFRIIGIFPGFVCKPTIVSADSFGYHACAVVRVIAFIGETVEEVTNIIEGGVFKIRDDYWDKLEIEEEEEEKEETKGEEKVRYLGSENPIFFERLIKDKCY